MTDCTSVLLKGTLIAFVCGSLLTGFGIWQYHEGKEWEEGAEEETCQVLGVKSKSICTYSCTGSSKCVGNAYKYRVGVLTTCAGKNYTWTDQCRKSQKYHTGQNVTCQVKNDCSELDLVLPSEHLILGIVLLVLGSLLLAPCVCVCCILLFSTVIKNLKEKFDALSSPKPSYTVQSEYGAHYKKDEEKQTNTGCGGYGGSQDTGGGVNDAYGSGGYNAYSGYGSQPVAEGGKRGYYGSAGYDGA